jgi:DNA-directed RNA polymerase subunit RPC12/RpoP
VKVEYKCPKCNTTGHSEVYRMGKGKDDGLYTCITCWRVWAEDYRMKSNKEEEECSESKKS